MLRKIVLALALLATSAGAFVTWTQGPAGVGLLVTGGLLLIGLLAERVYYKPIQDRPPDPRFQRTEERFRDPTSGAVVEVYVDPKTGERVYVRT